MTIQFQSQLNCSLFKANPGTPGGYIFNPEPTGVKNVTGGGVDSLYGHNHYAKCGRLYLQIMTDLRNTHPWLYSQFVDHGYHVVRRSDRYWAGLWTDLTIEQVMMKSIKSGGGLTHGSGFTDSVHLTWVHTMHSCGSVLRVMCFFTGLECSTSEQVKDLSKSRIKRDYKDLYKVMNYFDNNDPFNIDDHKLRSLSSGLTASDGDGINCDDADVVGHNILKKMDGFFSRSYF